MKRSIRIFLPIAVAAIVAIGAVGVESASANTVSFREYKSTQIPRTYNLQRWVRTCYYQYNGHVSCGYWVKDRVIPQGA